MSLKPGEFRSAVSALLQRRNVTFVRTIGALLAGNPDSLRYFKHSAVAEVRSRLWNQGNGQYVKEDAEALLILKEAVRRATRPSTQEESHQNDRNGDDA
jgi:hypothetical protein